jgi:hypothetical protein
MENLLALTQGGVNISQQMQLTHSVLRSVQELTDATKGRYWYEERSSKVFQSLLEANYRMIDKFNELLGRMDVVERLEGKIRDLEKRLNGD